MIQHIAFTNKFVFEKQEVMTKYYNIVHLNNNYNTFLGCLNKCKECELCEESKVILPEGDILSKYMFVGRASLTEDGVYDRILFPHNQVGKLFEKYLNYVDISREKAYITNAVLCKLINERDISLTSLYTCLMWKMVEMNLAKNCKVVFLMGNTALDLFLGYSAIAPRISSVIGNIYHKIYKGRKILVVPLYHPGSIYMDIHAQNQMFVVLKEVSKSMSLIEKDGFEWKV